MFILSFGPLRLYAAMGWGYQSKHLLHQATASEAVPCPSYIILVWVSAASKNTEVCDIMMSPYNIYVQAINYPTVARGEEVVRITPTPHTPDDEVLCRLQRRTFARSLRVLNLKQNASTCQSVDKN
ncbi:hypothetical protein DPEC_G00004960 [Dallia pectoralis]|uniref:Uncharacterized protein n=1 Tax=Dallia pectoralis TaxID=75939 RepID=A0ACC2HL67_DALPE|nr:hypothetical protein DPEC_G00004960 [Dallia pectoralis]